jgi:hypothetical protein
VFQSYEAEQVVPQSICVAFAGSDIEVTAPRRKPLLVTVKANCWRTKVATTDFAALIVTVQVVSETASHPFQLANIDPTAACAVSVTRRRQGD